MNECARGSCAIVPSDWELQVLTGGLDLSSSRFLLEG